MKILFSIIFFILININYAYSLNEIIIKFKIENEIITNKDIENEKNYLVSLNNDLLNISKKDLNKLAQDSMIREKIKKIEILKYIELDNDSSIVNAIIKDFYLSLGMKSNKEFEDYLYKFGINLNIVKEKLNIEANWNQLIFEKFKKQISIDVDKIKNKLQKDIKNEKYADLEYDLSEIVFQTKSNESLQSKLDSILKSINEIGFKNTSNLFSISENAKIGGKIGWINKAQLSNEVLKEIEKINVGEITKPIQIANAFLLLKINNKRKKKININFEDELNKLINVEKNEQYNQFSIIHFNKIKQNITINEF
tara:strand:- start:362 stop:1294 length:933 start_codon:yes stop_codon:yes gene_type:complete